MDTKIVKNYTIAQKLGLSHQTIARWVESSLKKDNNLQLTEAKGKYYILDNAHNDAELSKLKENALKYRNKTAFEKLNVDKKLYDILSPDQTIELITSLEYSRLIPLKFTYLGKGGSIWDEYVNKMANNDGYYLDELSSLLQSSLDYISLRIKNYSIVNIIDIGPGNGYTLKPLIEKLQRQTKVNYTGIDISDEMEKILKKNLDVWYPKLPVNLEIADMENMMIRSSLFNNKLKHNNSCNLLIFIGATIGNVNDRNRVLRNLKDSMGDDDYLLIDNGLDTIGWRSSFTTLNDPNYSSMLRWIPEFLGFRSDMYELINKYDEKTGRRLQTMKLNKDISLVFELENGVKTLEFKENEEITVWNHFSHTLNGYLKELSEADLVVTHLSCYPDLSHALSLCQVK